MVGLSKLLVESNSKLVLPWVSNPLHRSWNWWLTFVELDSLSRKIEIVQFIHVAHSNNLMATQLAEEGMRRQEIFKAWWVKIPIISLFAIAPSLPLSEYPNLFQTGGDESSRTKGIATLLESFGWRSVVLNFEDKSFLIQILSNVITSFEATNVLLALHLALLAASTDEEIIQQLMNLQT
ncbi:hypothetical protein GQ457_11G000060 [Hibiscus cannabinus]